ncbi:unannotated protein [freshwater metagenome]|uniref:Unannotated protein n=1 Tax=freshwater metagenome TaxID=449393 RepID=A0A6J7WDT9_9ZZZZ
MEITALAAAAQSYVMRFRRSRTDGSTLISLSNNNLKASPSFSMNAK